MPTRREILAAIPVAATLAYARPRSWKPRVGVIVEYSPGNLDWLKAEGFTSAQLRLDPAKLDDTKLAAVKAKIAETGIYISSLAVDGNHIASDPAERAKQNQYTLACIEMCGKLGIPNIGGQSGMMEGKKFRQQVDEIKRVYTEKYFPAMERNKVRLLWEPWAGGPNIATGPVGWDALFKAFGDSPHIGLQFDPSHLVWQFMDPIQAARDFVSKIYDVHLKDTEILWHILKRGGIQPVDRADWWRFRIPGSGQLDWKAFFAVLAEAGYSGAMNIENEDPFYQPDFVMGAMAEPFKRGCHVAHEFLKTQIPELTA